MKLYWAPRTRSLRALWVLEESGLPYEREVIDIRAGGQSTPEFRAINPMMKVPALADGAARVAESGAICAYVAEKAEGRLSPAPGDPARGRYLQWLFFAGNCIEPAFTQKFTNLQLPSSSAGWGDFNRVIEVLEEAVQPGPWLLGERFTSADVMIGSDLFFGIELFKIVEPRPAFIAYIDRCKARPAFKRALAIDNGEAPPA
jgi:glutathione S-transferase